MNFQPQIKADISKVVVITIFFTMINWYMTFYNDGIIMAYSTQPNEFYNRNLSYLMNTLTGIIAGILGGSALVYVNNRIFRRKSYGYALKATFLAFSTVFVFVMVTMAFFAARIKLGSEAGFEQLYAEASKYMFNKMAFIFYLFWGIVTLFTLFFLQVYDKFGSGMFLKFLTGRYHSPRQENRIFMFVDMKSSTAIAEQIGSKAYFNLLNELFTDITGAILSCEGEIYQYVGDEVVVSWSVDKGSRAYNCLRCFERIRAKVADLSPHYQQKYGVIPQFKAGLHCGAVTAGELGGVKRDIVYSGDVLNTASRIQEQCNNFQVDFLLSNETLDLLGKPESVQAVPMGKIELRGRQKSIDLFTLKAPQNQVA